MILCTIMGTIVVALYFNKICKFNKLISTLAALPGAFVVIAGAINDIAKTEKESGQVVIPQATRVLFIVLFLPFIFVTQVGYQEIQSFGNTPTFTLRYFLELIFLIGVSFLGTKILEKFKIPSAPILAAMIVAGFFYTFEFTTAKFPDIFINIAFVLLGSAIGCRLSGLAPKEILFYSFHGAVMSAILLAIAGFFAYLLKIFLGFDFMSTFLSFAPGGLHEMVVISVAYNIDPLFVSYHHFLRIFFIILTIPFILKIIKRD